MLDLEGNKLEYLATEISKLPSVSSCDSSSDVLMVSNIELKCFGIITQAICGS